jgi:hypothetical protein
MTATRPLGPNSPELCPVCKEEVPPGALACPECGADHNSGWREDADAYDGVDLPDEDFNYNDFVKREFGARVKPTGLKIVWWLVGLLVILAFLLMYLYSTK